MEAQGDPRVSAGVTPFFACAYLIAGHPHSLSSALCTHLESRHPFIRLLSEPTASNMLSARNCSSSVQTSRNQQHNRSTSGIAQSLQVRLVPLQHGPLRPGTALMHRPARQQSPQQQSARSSSHIARITPFDQAWGTQIDGQVRRFVDCVLQLGRFSADCWAFNLCQVVHRTHCMPLCTHRCRQP